MKRRLSYFIFIALLFPFSLFAQELFPHNDPASNIPKGVLGVRLSNEFYKEINQVRSLQIYRFMFGLSSRWMLSQSFSFSNHHYKLLPEGMIVPHGGSGLAFHEMKMGNKYPYRFDTFTLSIRYRFLSRDANHSHVRMAAVLDLGGGTEPHTNAEPNLMSDNGGLGIGWITTVLKKKFALSLNTSFVLPANYNEAFSNIQIRYGKALNLNLSVGYLLFPRTYQSYKQTNVNVYFELLGKTYGKGSMYKNDTLVSLFEAPAYGANSYLEGRPSLQFIFNSNTRIDLSCALPILGRTLGRSYPTFYFNIQRYFYFKK